MRYILGVLFATSAFAQTAVFPGAVAGDAQMAVAVNQVQTVLRYSIGSSDTSATVVSSTGFVANSIASISGPGNSGSSEEVWVCSVVGNVLSVGRASCPNIDGRGIDSTNVVAHNAGAQVSAYVDAWHHNSEKVEITAIENYVLNNAVLPGTAVLDTAYSTFAAACTAGAGKILYVTKIWTAVPSQTCADYLLFFGGRIQPGSGQVVALTGTIAAPQTVRIFDTSVSGVTGITLTAKCCAWMSPDWWGAKTDGSDSLAAFNAAKAIALSGVAIPLWLDSGTYAMSGSWTFDEVGLSTSGPWEVRGGGANDFGGYGRIGSWLNFSAGGVVINSYVFGVRFRDVGVHIGASAGPGFKLSGTVGSFSFPGVPITSENPATSLIEVDTGGSGDVAGFDGDSNLIAATGASVPAIYFHTSATSGVVSPVHLGGSFLWRWVGNTTMTAPFFYMNCGTTAQCNEVSMDNILTEVTPAGAAHFKSVTNVNLTNFTQADSGTLTDASVKITAGAGQIIGQYTCINCFLFDGTASLTTPSLLIDVGSSNGQIRATATGGNIAYTRIIGNTNGATVLMSNVKHTDLYDITEISTTAALGTAGTISTGADGPMNGGTYNSAIQVMPYSTASALANAKCVKAADLAIDATDTHKVTSASWTPNSDDLNRYVIVYSGAGFHLSVPNRIIKVSGGAAFLVSEVGTAGSTGGTFSTNRFSIGFENDRFVPGNAMDYLLACSANADATVTAKQIPMTIPAIAFASLPTINKPTFAIITDSNTNTWGANIAGGGANTVLAYWNGSNWTVMAK